MQNDCVAFIRDHVRKAIESGTFAVGQKLPTERELAAQFDVPRSAVRAAITPLEIGGMVKREIGRGTYVLYQGGVIYNTPATGPIATRGPGLPSSK